MVMLPYNYTDDWGTIAEIVTNQLITSAENIIPELKEHIVSRHTITPRNHEQNTLNNQGASRGWSPLPGIKDKTQKTPIRNLFLAGHWTFSFFPEGGIAAAVASGRDAADLVLKGLPHKV